MAESNIGPGTFDIAIQGRSGVYSVRANGPRGIQTPPHDFPSLDKLFTPEQRDILARLRQDEGGVSGEDIQDVGRVLYRALFVETELNAEWVKAASGRGLRLRLLVEPPELAALPWEAMISTSGELVGANPNAPLVRRTETLGGAISGPAVLREQLRILYVGCTPFGMDELYVADTAAELESILRASPLGDRITFDAHFDITLEQFQELLKRPYHAVCFVGHGEPGRIFLDAGDGEFKRDPRTGEFVLDEQGEKIWLKGQPYGVTADRIASAIRGNSTLRLVFLSACHSAAVTEATGGSMAQELAARTQLAAVVGMQYFIGYLQARELTKRFFRWLVEGDPMDVAFVRARSMLRTTNVLNRDVITPVMFLQVEETDRGELFVEAETAVEPEKEPVPARDAVSVFGREIPRQWVWMGSGVALALALIALVVALWPRPPGPSASGGGSETPPGVVIASTATPTPSPTPTITPTPTCAADDVLCSLERTSAESPSFDWSPYAWTPDEDCPASRLRVGMNVYLASQRATLYPEPRAVNQVGEVRSYRGATVIDGPVCTDGDLWWKVRSFEPEETAAGWRLQVLEGWTVEHGPQRTILRPTANLWSNMPGTMLPCPGLAASRLHLGDVAVVSFEPPINNEVWDRPSRANGQRVEPRGNRLDPGDPFRVIDGPLCAEGRIWWQIEEVESSLSGWTTEGVGRFPYLLPINKLTGQKTRPAPQGGYFAFRNEHVTVDGSFDDWPDEWRLLRTVVYGQDAYAGPDDISGAVQVAWSQAGLFVALQVSDDRYQASNNMQRIFRGDSVEITFDRNLAADFESGDWSADDYQYVVGFGPEQSDPTAYQYNDQASPAGEAGGLTSVVTPTEDGYAAELLLPWSWFGLLPEGVSGGGVYGFGVSLNDNDRSGEQLETMVSASPVRNRPNDPTEWGTLVLLPAIYPEPPERTRVMLRPSCSPDRMYRVSSGEAVELWVMWGASGWSLAAEMSDKIDFTVTLDDAPLVGGERLGDPVPTGNVCGAPPDNDLDAHWVVERFVLEDLAPGSHTIRVTTQAIANGVEDGYGLHWDAGDGYAPVQYTLLVEE